MGSVDDRRGWTVRAQLHAGEEVEREVRHQNDDAQHAVRMPMRPPFPPPHRVLHGRLCITEDADSPLPLLMLGAGPD
jgi:hypothetical protein